PEGLPETPIPTACPACGTPVEREEGEIALFCPNLACPGRRLEALVHFASRGAMDIRGLSYARIEQMVNARVDEGGDERPMVRDVADIYGVTLEQLLTLE